MKVTWDLSDKPVTEYLMVEGKTYKGVCSDDPKSRLSVQECEMAESRPEGSSVLAFCLVSAREWSSKECGS